MEKYKPGIVFELFKNDNQEYMIVNSVEKKEKVYLLIVPVYKQKGEIKTDYTKVLLVNVDKRTDDIEIEKDESVIREIVEKTMKKM